MKKILIIIAIIIGILCTNNDEGIIIPNDAIRYRIIAASNSTEDQIIKNKLSKEVEKYLIELTSFSRTTEETKKILLKNKDDIEKFVDNYLDVNNIDEKFSISIGKNYFPKKNFKGVEYDAGYYDSIVVNLGKGVGLNWWCVIYPPLCLIDEDTTEVEYTTFASEILEQFNM